MAIARQVDMAMIAQQTIQMRLLGNSKGRICLCMVLSSAFYGLLCFFYSMHGTEIVRLPPCFFS